MQLGTQTASIINNLHSRAVIGQPSPSLGMAATLLAWTDRYSGTVTGITLNGGQLQRIEVTRDKTRRTDKNGLSECQEYEYTTDPQGESCFFRIGKNGRWEEIRLNQETGRWIKTNGYGLLLGTRDHYIDPTF